MSCEQRPGFQQPTCVIPLQFFDAEDGRAQNSTVQLGMFWNGRFIVCGQARLRQWRPNFNDNLFFFFTPIPSSFAGKEQVLNSRLGVSGYPNARQSFHSLASFFFVPLSQGFTIFHAHKLSISKIHIFAINSFLV